MMTCMCWTHLQAQKKKLLRCNNVAQTKKNPKWHQHFNNPFYKHCVTAHSLEIFFAAVALGVRAKMKQEEWQQSWRTTKQQAESKWFSEWKSACCPISWSVTARQMSSMHSTFKSFSQERWRQQGIFWSKQPAVEWLFTKVAKLNSTLGVMNDMHSVLKIKKRSLFCSCFHCRHWWTNGEGLGKNTWQASFGQEQLSAHLTSVVEVDQKVVLLPTIQLCGCCPHFLKSHLKLGKQQTKNASHCHNRSSVDLLVQEKLRWTFAWWDRTDLFKPWCAKGFGWQMRRVIDQRDTVLTSVIHTWQQRNLKRATWGHPPRCAHNKANFVGKAQFFSAGLQKATGGTEQGLKMSKP